MINPQVIKQFLESKGEDWSWIKQISRPDLIKAIEKIDQQYSYKTYPAYKHQLAMYLIGLLSPNFLFFADPGTGKSRVSIDIINYYKSTNQVNKSLILSYNVTSAVDWQNQIKLHSNLSSVALIGTKAERLQLLEKDVDIYIINYTGLQTILTNLINHKRVPDKYYATQFARRFDALIFDEIHLLKNIQSLNYKLASILANNIKYRYGLTGSPFGRDPMDLWSQFHVIDGGETLSKYITIFREAFFNQKENYWGGIDYTFDYRKEVKLAEKLSNRSVFYAEDEVNELPERVVITPRIVFPHENFNYYKDLLSRLIESVQDRSRAENLWIRLRQLFSGFVHFKNDEGEEAEVTFEENPKMDMLLELIDSIPKHKKIVIFNFFIKSGDLIAQELKKNKIKFERLYGKSKDKITPKKNFIENPDIRVFLVNTESGSTALDGLQNVCHYVICYELPVSPITYKQMIHRVHRTGQQHKTFIYQLVVANSIEEKIVGFLEEGKDLFDALIKGEEKIHETD